MSLLPGSESFAGRLLRLPLRAIPSNATVRVLRGPLRGARWVVGSGSHGCWLGHYEQHVQRALVSLLRPGLAVYDVGANVGFFTLLAGRLVGVDGTVVALEPSSRNVEFLERHVRLNSLDNVRVMPVAAGRESGRGTFRTGGDSSTGRLAPEGDLGVEVRRLDDLPDARDVRAPDVIKIDVEGAEEDVLRGAARILRLHHPSILLAFHGSRRWRACSELLQEHAYETRLIGGSLESGLGEVLATPAGAPT